MKWPWSRRDTVPPRQREELSQEARVLTQRACAELGVAYEDLTENGEAQGLVLLDLARRLTVLEERSKEAPYWSFLNTASKIVL
jgi:hypothetical protein